jgi:hypothetical protein
MCNKIKQLFFYKADLLLFTKKNSSSKKGIKKPSKELMVLINIDLCLFLK